MATRSRIAIENQDGTVDSIYCHWDGYLSGVGETLMDHYSDREKLEKLLELGNLSALEATLEDTIAYCRDRGDDLKFKTFSNMEELFNKGFIMDEEFVYCFTKDSIWLVNENGSSSVRYLKEELEGESI
jgi:hypothetical protein